MAEESPLLVRRDGAVIWATLNRPAKRNALNTELGQALDGLLEELATDSAARVLVLSGAGGHFCAGLDLTEVAAGDTPEEKLAAQQVRNRAIGRRYEALAALPQVVIVAVEGAAHAGGLGFICAADFAFASAEARFAAPEVRRGLVPAQILPWLVRRMGRSAAACLVLEGGVIEAPAALRLGLVHEVAETPGALAALVDHTVSALRAGAPKALAETKGLLAALGPVAPPGYADAGAEAFGRCAAGNEAAEGIAAFREKRSPAWAH